MPSGAPDGISLQLVVGGDRLGVPREAGLFVGTAGGGVGLVKPGRHADDCGTHFTQTLKDKLVLAWADAAAAELVRDGVVADGADAQCSRSCNLPATLRSACPQQ